MRVHLGGDLIADFDRRVVERGGVDVPVSPKALKLLEVLVLAWPAAVSREDLYKQLFPDTNVDEGSLHNLVSEVRGLDRRWRVVRTLHRFGYAMAVEPETGEEPSCRSFVEHGRRHLALRLGENIVGRDPGAGVRVFAPGVSRRHARIMVAKDSTATIEDAGSKNGTFLGKDRVERATPLREGDEIFLGTLMLVFRTRDAAASTVTEIR